MKRVLIVGCGDVARRALPWLTARFRVYALVRRAEVAAAVRAAGAVPVAGDLDDLRSLARIAGIADYVFHFAPPPDGTSTDPRTARLLAALSLRGSLPCRLVYISTSGVYGDCRGARIDETRPLRPATARARRRVDAERRLRDFARRGDCSLAILRAPGIYARERLGLERLRRGDPVLLREEDVFTNHIHADDLARAATQALFRGGNCRAFNISDNAELRMGDYYDAMADAAGLPRPPRASRAECVVRLGQATLSFMAESRRLDNRRMRRELRLALAWPDVGEALPRLL